MSLEEDHQGISVVQELEHAFGPDGKPTSWTDVYVKIKTAFRQKALRLLKGSTAMPATRNGCGNRDATRKSKLSAKPPGLHRSTLGGRP